MYGVKIETKKAKSIKALQSILEDHLKMRYLTKELFRLIDKDSNNIIELKEMYNYMVNMADLMNCETPNFEDVKDIFSSFDLDNDMMISIEEFEIFVREILESMIEKETETARRLK